MANEKRLIDANALVDLVLNHPRPYRRDFYAMINNAPTVEAVEVVHGHMVERIVDHECPWYTVYDCSECGCSVESWHSYCPNCGAKMDGDWNA